MKIIPYGRQYIDHQDIRLVSKALKEDLITTGSYVKKFENKINKYLKCKYSVSCNSGTSALYLALKSINLKKNDVIIMPSITFVASYNVAKILGCRIYLADIDLNSCQMTPEKIIECCKKNNLKKVKAIVVMYNGGYPENAENFIKLKKKYGSVIIEDACHALGSSYRINNKIYKIGSCKHADISTFSLHPVKTITTGEGGIVTTNKKKFFEKIKLLRSHGIKKNIQKHWKYDVQDISLNFRLSDIQCALGSSQFNKINRFILKRKRISETYCKYLETIKEISFNILKKKYHSAYHLFIIKINKKRAKEKLIKFMLKNKIILQYHYIPIYKFKIYKKAETLKNAEEYFKTAVSLPIYYKLSLKKQMIVINKLKEFFNT